jgi:hypothetical protein
MSSVGRKPRAFVVPVPSWVDGEQVAHTPHGDGPRRGASPAPSTKPISTRMARRQVGHPCQGKDHDDGVKVVVEGAISDTVRGIGRGT